MKKILLILAFAFVSSAALADSVDSCKGPEVVANNWFVTVNSDDQASKQDILAVLDAIAICGFCVGGIFSFPSSPDKTFFITFNPAYYPDAERAAAVKEEVLKSLLATPTVTLECNLIAHPA